MNTSRTNNIMTLYRCYSVSIFAHHFKLQVFTSLKGGRYFHFDDFDSKLCIIKKYEYGQVRETSTGRIQYLENASRYRDLVKSGTTFSILYQFVEFYSAKTRKRGFLRKSLFRLRYSCNIVPVLREPRKSEKINCRVEWGKKKQCLKKLKHCAFNQTFGFITHIVHYYRRVLNSDRVQLI